MATQVDISPDAPTEVRASRVKLAGSNLLARYSGVGILILLIIVFGIIEPNTFLTTETLRTVLSNQAITAIMALSLLLPLAAGVFDLSIGSVMGLAIMLVADFQAHGMPWGVSVAVVLAIGAGIGLLNALIVVRFGVDSFIATLGSSSIITAFVLNINGGEQIITGISTHFTDIATAEIFTIALPVFYMLALCLVLWHVLEYRQLGRYTFATGSNRDAARLAGVRVDRYRLIALVVSATIATLAGIIFTAKTGAASPDSGPPYLLPAFAGAYLGATQIKQGRFNVLGTLVAVFLLGVGVEGLQLSSVPDWIDNAFSGAALIVAVGLSVRTSRRRRQ